MNALAFTVYGRPQPAGSKRAFPVRRGDRVHVSVTDANQNAKPWQYEVRQAAVDALAAAGGTDGGLILLTGPLRLDVKFWLARPKAHFGTGRNAGVVKWSAPLRPTARPDTTKLLRGVEDALTGAVWHDDAQVVVQLAEKLYADDGVERCEVYVGRMFPAVWAGPA